MKTGYVSALAILLAAGCAHRAPAEPPVADARDHSDRHAPRAVTVDEQNERAHDHEGERVEVPNHAAKDEHLASAGGDLPAHARAHEHAKAVDPHAPAPAAEYGAKPDNTRVNERDRDANALTPMDQSESQSDRDLVQRIRKAVIADDSLSFTAKNVKIITRDGQVTLRGAVNNAHEKAAIEKAAREAAGPKHVTNELEVSN